MCVLWVLVIIVQNSEWMSIRLTPWGQFVFLEQVY